MARRSLKPQLNQIRAWVQQGRTDAWIAHQLEISTSELREFRKQHGLTADSEDAGSTDVDLRDEIEAEIEAATADEPDEEEAEEEAEDEELEPADEDEADEESEGDGEKREPRRERRERREPRERPARQGEGGERPRRRRRRGRRGGRGRRKEIEATFDHGERDGYGLWLDAAVKDNPVYAERWAGKREVTVRIEADQIVIRRAGEPAGGASDSNE